MEERRVTREQVFDIIKHVPPFVYRHRRQTQSGYWDRNSGILVAVGNNIITTVMVEVDEDYVRELKSR